MLKLDLTDVHLEHFEVQMAPSAYTRMFLQILVPTEDVGKVMQELKAEMNLGHTNFKREKGKLC